MHGERTFQTNVTSRSEDGFGLKVGEEALFLRFADFPWFQGASTAQLCHIEQPSRDHLYWPLLDIDLSVQSIRDPSAFPLVSARKL